MTIERIVVMVLTVLLSRALVDIVIYLIKRNTKKHPKYESEEIDKMINRMMEIIEERRENTETKTGYWIYDDSYEKYEKWLCSECMEESVVQLSECPNCHAKMTIG